MPGSNHLKEIFEKSPTPDKMIPPSGTASAYYDRNVLLNGEAKERKREITLAPIDPLVSGGWPQELKKEKKKKI